MNCHASVYVPSKKLGGGDIVKGFEQMNQMPYFEARKQVNHPVACIDCHDSQTMHLRVTRPGFIEGMRTLKASQGIAGYDVNAMASRQEMRVFVCGQCHVEYYFKGKETRLTYPWAKGLEVDEILQYRKRIRTATRPTPTPARRSSRRSIPNSKCGTRGSTRAPAWRAPIATCPICASAR